MDFPCMEYWIRRLICSNCKLPLKPPIYYCQNATSPHPTCSDCNNCLAKLLGFCGSKPGATRSAMLENLVGLVKFTCVYKCKKNRAFSSNEYRKHLQKCHLRPLTCCLCKSEVVFKEYVAHLTSVHFVQSQRQERMLLGGNFSFDFTLGQPKVEYAELENQTFLFRYDDRKFWIEILSTDEEADVDYYVLISGLRSNTIGVRLRLLKCRDGEKLLGKPSVEQSEDFQLNTHFVIPEEDDLIYVSIVPENDNLSISSLNESEEDRQIELTEITQYMQDAVNDQETDRIISEKRESLGNIFSKRNGSISDLSDAGSSEVASLSSAAFSDDGFNGRPTFAANLSVAFPHKDCKKSRNEVHCEHIIQEILTTEQSYVKNLNTLIAGYGSVAVSTDLALIYLLPEELKKFSKKYKTPDGTEMTELNYNRALLGNLEEIFLFHYQHFLPRLSESTSSPSLIAQTFMDFRDQMYALYCHYCHLLPSCSKLVKELGDENPWLKSCQQRIGHKFDLASCLVAPIQRVTKYQLFFKDLIKHCDDSEEFAVLERAYNGIINMLHGVNTSASQSHIVNYDTLYDEGPLTTQAPFRIWTENDTYSISGHSRICFLYPKSILICKKDPDPTKSVLHFKTRVSLDAIGLTENLPGNHPNRFELWTPGKEKVRYQFEAESKEVKDIWISEIKKCLLQQLEDIRQARSKLTGLPLGPSAVDILWSPSS